MYDIQLKTVSKTYLGTNEPAVKNLSLNVEKGSIITLLGPSGCGKSTTLRLIAGFERAEGGSISLAGKIVSDENTWVPPEKRGVGMVFQDYALFPHLNVFDNIGFGYKEKDRKSRVMEVLELVNLKGFEKRYPYELSGGQQQRVALARALARRPVVVLLDEPFSNLDADLRVTMRVEVKRILKEAGATAIFVSHDQKDALAISDVIAVMKDGVLEQIGTPREIYRYPENKFVASFIGQSNIIKGKISDDGLSVFTNTLGSVSCNHSHCMCAGEEVCISIRPDSIIKDANGHMEGRVKEFTYTGETIDAVITITSAGEEVDLLMHIHPEENIKTGEIIRFKLLPNFVAVVKNE
ncbi:iron(III) transport system ATP-binding protein [Natronincola peptidivorans]|uniref:ABC-type quaternary amine transporter n=1 Tax=Natronincola peptidivorans TaxID=426128 RepID=A0A1I0ALD4_9FIRM|nr:ABC transporter ATP-binding protein [Natronincola peptidivorans]SES95190.1 iron(III) transport system ATP-binding protein [Natronincola peptidivorans]